MALLRGVVEQLLDEFFSLFIMNKLRELKIFLHYFLINFIGSLGGIAKRQGAAQKLIEADTQRPQIDKISIAFSQDNIGGHVMGRADNGECTRNLIGDVSAGYLRCGKVNQLEVAFLVDKEVLRLNIAADYLYFLEVFQDKDDAGSVKLSIGS